MKMYKVAWEVAAWYEGQGFSYQTCVMWTTEDHILSEDEVKSIGIAWFDGSMESDGAQWFAKFYDGTEDDYDDDPYDVVMAWVYPEDLNAGVYKPEPWRETYGKLMDKCNVKNGSGREVFSFSQLDDDEVKWIVEKCPCDVLENTDDGGNSLYEIAHDLGYVHVDGDIIGKWVGSDIDVMYLGGYLYALDGWNGEKWCHCWRCKDRFTADQKDADEGREYEIIPVYDWDHWNEEEEQFQTEDGEPFDGIIDYWIH